MDFLAGLSGSKGSTKSNLQIIENDTEPVNKQLEAIARLKKAVNERNNLTNADKTQEKDNLSTIYANTQKRREDIKQAAKAKAAANAKEKSKQAEIAKVLAFIGETRKKLEKQKKEVDRLPDTTNQTITIKGNIAALVEALNEETTKVTEAKNKPDATVESIQQAFSAFQTAINTQFTKIQNLINEAPIIDLPKRSMKNTISAIAKTINRYESRLTPVQKRMKLNETNRSSINNIKKRASQRNKNIIDYKQVNSDPNYKTIIDIKTRLMSEKDSELLPEQRISNKDLPLVEIDNCNVITNLLDMNPNTVYLYKMNSKEREKALKDSKIAALLKNQTDKKQDIALACYVNTRDNQYNYKPVLSSQLQDEKWMEEIKDHNSDITYYIQGFLLDSIQRQVQGSTTNQKSLSNKVVNKMQFINDKNKAELVNIYAINDDYAIDFLEKNPTKGIIRLKMLKTENMNWYPVLSKKDGDNVIDIKLDDLIKDNRGQELLFRKPIPNMQTLKTTHGLDGITFQWETVLKAVELKLYNDYLKRKGRYNKNQVEERVSPINNQEEAEAKHADDNPRSMTTSTPKPNKNSEADSASVDPQDVKVNIKNSTESSGGGTGLNLTGGKRHHSSRNKTVKKNKRQPRRNRTHRK